MAEELDRDAIVKQAAAAGTNTRIRWVIVGLALVSAVALTLAILSFQRGENQAADRADTAEAKLVPAQDTVTAVREICAAGGEAKRILLSEAPGACEDAKEADENIEDVGEDGTPGEQGDPGRPATPAEILAVIQQNPEVLDASIRRYCAITDCRGEPGESLDVQDAIAAFSIFCNRQFECVGPRGAQGLPGPGPTDEQLTAIVTAYCSTRNECIGAVGPQGQPGQDATPEMIAQQVNDYCAARNNCQGPKGDTGDKGDPGRIQDVVLDNCDPVDGEFITSISRSFDETTSVLTLRCEKASAVPPDNGGLLQ